MNKEAKIRTIALKSLQIEAQTLAALQSSINDDFCHAIECIQQGKGRIIVTGLGKSALVARKIVATPQLYGNSSYFYACC